MCDYNNFDYAFIKQCFLTSKCIPQDANNVNEVCNHSVVRAGNFSSTPPPFYQHNYFACDLIDFKGSLTCEGNQFTLYCYYRNIIVSRDATILQYIDILQYSLLQYNTIRLMKNIDILHIAIYCNIFCLTSCKNPIITLQKLLNQEYTVQFYVST